MSGGGSGGQTYQTSTSSSESGPPTPIAETLNRWGTDLSKYYNGHPNAPAWFPRSTVAQFSPQTQTGINALYARGQNGSPVLTAANRNAAATLAGQYLDPSNNPWLQKSLAAGFNTQNEQFNNTVLPSLRSQFAAAGRTGGSEDFDTALRAAKDLSQAQANAAATAELGAYNAERGNQLQALGLAPALAGQDFANLDAMLRAGGLLDAKAQQNIDADVARWNYEQTAQPNYITDMAQKLQAIYPGGTTKGQNTSFAYSMRPSDPTSDILGGILGGAGLGLQALQIPGVISGLSGLAAASDRRMKTDIEKLGKDPLTGLPMYAYRYKGDPKTYPKVVGPMAQDIERAGGPVREIGGHKVLPLGGLM